MKTTIVWVLAGLNALLLATFLSRYTADNVAHAQAAARRTPDFTIIPGEIPGVSGEVLFVIDGANNQLGAFSYDSNVGRLDAMSTVDLARVFQGGGAAGVVPGAAGATPGVNVPGRR